MVRTAARHTLSAAVALAASSGWAGAEDPERLIAFCRPLSQAAERCFCSVERIEVAVTPGQFVLLMRDRRAAGAASAAELRDATRHAHEVCGPDAVAASLHAIDAGAAGAATSLARLPAAPARGGAP